MPVRKRFGQHFLHDRGIIGRIVEQIAPQAGQRFLEIGPGRGALTFALLKVLPELEAIEIDRDLAAGLARDARAEGRLRLHVADALDADFVGLRGAGARLRIIGNLPYNISTPLLFRLIDQRSAIEDIHVMLQKEVVERMTARPGGKEYGRLSVMLAAYSRVQNLFDVGPGAFQPPPRVWSSVARLLPSAEPLFEIGDHAALRTVVTAAFSHRRKTLKNALQGLLDPSEIDSCGIDPASRPGVLEPAQFGQLALRWRRRQDAASIRTE
ncbi:MAG: 16S rRNA (adenine(1518)-N(6)/adenine(1519)-N(6))-dimethyltransferase RsmA [Steroidobacteraceae bacterium]|nr:16S rRNA (adenine(1518)-N(6)/adenine(1519)-N(6))-dimethyltransferase RsmA [Steroidobacteraceae bacterium]